MQALILTEDQATALLAANGQSNRCIEPRRLEDGRLILNADILDDPFFSDPARPWADILAGQQVTTEEPAQAEIGALAEDIATSFAKARSQIVSLTEADLAEPQ